MRSEFETWNRSVDKSITGADYPEGRVLPSGRTPRKTPQTPAANPGAKPDPTREN